MQEDKPYDVARVAAALGLEPERVLNVYQFGSRVYGRTMPDSDWDFRIVVRGWEGPEHLDDIAPDLNACIYSEAQWEALIAEHDILTLVCINLPEHNVWKEERKDWRINFFNWGLSLKKLVRGVLKERCKTWDKSRRFCFKVMRKDKRIQEESDEDIKRKLIKKREEKLKIAKKNLVHGVRYMMFGLEIVRKGRITDFGAANSFFEEVMGIDHSYDGGQKVDWKFFDDTYKGIFTKLEKELRTEVREILEQQVAIQVEKEKEEEVSGLSLLSFLNEREGNRSIQELGLYYAISVSHNPSYHPDLFLLHSDREDSPQEVKLVRECKGTVVRRLGDTQKWDVCCYPYEIMADGNDAKVRYRWMKQTGIAMNSTEVTVFEQVCGIPVSLYCLDGEWRVSSFRAIDASEKVKVKDKDNALSLGDLFWKLLPGGKEGTPKEEDNATIYLWDILPSSEEEGSKTWYHQQQQKRREEKEKDEEEAWISRHYGLVLHGVKIRKEGGCWMEVDPTETAEKYGWVSVRKVPGMTVEAALKEIRRLSPLSKERRGFVCCDSKFEHRRMRLASPLYLLLKDMPEAPLDTTYIKNKASNTAFNRKQMLEVVRVDWMVEHAEEFLRVRPQWRAVYEEVAMEFKSACQKLQGAFETVSGAANGKGFAKVVSSHPKWLSNALYEMKRDAYTLAFDYLYDMPIVQLVHFITKFNAEAKKEKK